VENYIQEFSSKYKKSAPDIDSEVITQLVNYDWPGNVRELRNTIERMILLNDKPSIMSEHLPENIRSKLKANPTSLKKGEISRQEQEFKNSEALEIEEALRKTYGNKSAAASLLGISRGTLYNKIKEYGLS
jgi:transcriptional regulator with PAS, ATPase and Fis domain